MRSVSYTHLKSEVDWEKQDTPMVSRRILITQPKMNGKQLGEFHFSSMYGVNVTRVNRSGMDIFASRNLTLQVGDRVMVVGPQDAVELSLIHILLPKERIRPDEIAKVFAFYHHFTHRVIVDGALQFGQVVFFLLEVSNQQFG